METYRVFGVDENNFEYDTVVTGLNDVECESLGEKELKARYGDEIQISRIDFMGSDW